MDVFSRGHSISQSLLSTSQFSLWKKHVGKRFFSMTHEIRRSTSRPQASKRFWGSEGSPTRSRESVWCVVESRAWVSLPSQRPPIPKGMENMAMGQNEEIVPPVSIQIQPLK